MSPKPVLFVITPTFPPQQLLSDIYSSVWFSCAHQSAQKYTNRTWKQRSVVTRSGSNSLIRSLKHTVGLVAWVTAPVLPVESRLYLLPAVIIVSPRITVNKAPCRRTKNLPLLEAKLGEAVFKGGKKRNRKLPRWPGALSLSLSLRSC